eukprot:13603448-Alexandrium_andersonii.AAC.1
MCIRDSPPAPPNGPAPHGHGRPAGSGVRSRKGAPALAHALGRSGPGVPQTRGAPAGRVRRRPCPEGRSPGSGSE